MELTVYQQTALHPGGCVCLLGVTEVSNRVARHSQTGREVNRILESCPWHQIHKWTCEHLLQCSVGMKLNRAVVTQGTIMHRCAIFFRCWSVDRIASVNEFHFDNVPAMQGTLLRTSVLHTLRGKTTCPRALISHKSDALIGMLINTNDSTLTSPGAEASGFQSSFSSFYSVLEQILPIYWHFNTLPVSSTCSHSQPLSDGGQQYKSAAGVRAQSNSDD